MGGGEGVLPISSVMDDRRIFLVGNFGNCFFRWLDLSRDCFGHSKQSEVSLQCPRILAA